MLDGVKAVLLDIEGTTTPITFVKDKLFPYVRENVKSHFESHWEEEECQADIDALRTQAAAAKEDKEDKAGEIPGKDANQEDIIKATVDYVLALMDVDSKVTGLKTLQGHMWREAYKTEKILGEVYEDVVVAMKDWVSSGMKIFVYSSGSEEAQKLLFGYSDQGDLLEHVSGHYDTTVGPKQDKTSYTKIAEKAGIDVEDFLFLTDLPEEAVAAAEAGMRTTIVVREGNAALSAEDVKRFNTVKALTELAALGSQDAPAKRLDAEGDADEDDDDDDVEEADDVDDDAEGADGDDD